jgi:hypothetical protein
VPVKFEDLLAARLLSKQAPDKRQALLAALDALKVEGGSKSLLTTLVERQVLTMEQARYVHHGVERYKRSRGLAIYASLLAREGMNQDRVKQLCDQVGQEADMNQLGDLVLSMGQLPPAREHQVRFQARLALDRDQAQQLQAWVDQQKPAAAAAGAEAGEARATIGINVSGLHDSQRFDGSGVIKLPPMEEAQKIVRGTLSDADDELPGPQFRIPEWIDMSDPRTGKSVAGFRILGRIGAGAMGTVYLCDKQDEPKRPVALKLLPKDATQDARGRFKREILANSFFSHPGAIEIYDAGVTDQGHEYMAMEFFDGKDLSVVLDAEKRITAKRALTLMRGVFEALQAAHEAGLIHRDIKPGNILVNRDGESGKLMDFGIALIRDLGEFETKVFHSMEGGVTGTPEFMSPEQAGGDALTASSDLYSMGCVLYYMLSGRLPFESETSQGFVSCHLLEDPLPLAKAHADCKALPKELLDLVDGLLKKSPKQRPATAADVIKAIDAILPKLKDKKDTKGFWGMLWGK